MTEASALAPPAVGAHPAVGPSRSKWPIAIGLVAAIAALILAVYFLVARLHSVQTDDAYVEAHITTVTAKVPAYVQRLHIDDNARVKGGDVLVELDPRDYVVLVDVARANLAAAASKLQESQSQVAIANAGIEQAKAELVVAQSNATLAEANWKRVHSVSDARAVSNERQDTTYAASESARAAVIAAQAKVRSQVASGSLSNTAVKTATASVAQAQAALDQALLNLSYTKITAIESGSIANKTVEEGNYVQPGQMLFSLVPERSYVIANFKETQLQGIRQGDAAIVWVDAYPDMRLRGHVDSIQRGTGSVFALLPPENATGNFVKVVQRVPVKILIDDADAYKWITPGMSVEARVSVAH